MLLQGNKEDLIDFITTLTPQQLDQFETVLDSWDGEGDQLIEVAAEYVAVAIGCRAEQSTAKPDNLPPHGLQTGPFMQQCVGHTGIEDVINADAT